MALHDSNKQSNVTFLAVKHLSICTEERDPQGPDHEANEKRREELAKLGYVKMPVKDPSKKNPDGSDFYMDKWIKKFGGGVDGLITGIKWYSNEAPGGKKFQGIKIAMRDGAERYVLDLAFGTKPYDSFVKLMENIDYSQKVLISAWQDMQALRQKNKVVTAFAIYQNDETIKWKWTREQMRDTLRAYAAQFPEDAVEAEGYAVDGEVPEVFRAKMEERGFLICPGPVHDMTGWDFRAQRIWLYKRLKEIVIPHVEEMYKFDEDEPEYDESDEVEAATAAAAAAPIPPVPVPQAPAAGNAPYAPDSIAMTTLAEPARVWPGQEQPAAAAAADDDIPF